MCIVDLYIIRFGRVKLNKYRINALSFFTKSIKKSINKMYIICQVRYKIYGTISRIHFKFNLKVVKLLSTLLCIRHAAFLTIILITVIRLNTKCSYCCYIVLYRKRIIMITIFTSLRTLIK